MLLRIFMHMLFFLALSNCESDNDDFVTPVVQSSFTYDGETYLFSDGWIEEENNPLGGIDHINLALFSSDVDWENSPKEPKGFGHLIFIRFRDPGTGNRLVPETYNYQRGLNGPDTLTSSSASFSINWDYESQVGKFGFFREGSNVIVKEVGANYSLSFTLIPTLDLGNITVATPIIGSYNGPLKRIN